jgi:glutamate dehydrogenase (NAD(P)+)
VPKLALERQELVLGPEPQITFAYRDPLTGTHGHLVIDTLALGRAYGGLRLVAGLDVRGLAGLARLGTIRYQLARVNLGGAKCGLDCDPAHPYRQAILQRFCRVLRPYLDSVLTLGPDIGIARPELEEVLHTVGLPSHMHAIQTAEGWSESDWRTYLEALSLPARFGTIKDIQVPYFAVRAAHIAIAQLLPSQRAPRIVVLGLGPFGLCMARLFQELGCQVLAVANGEIGCFARDGLPAAELELCAKNLTLAGASTEFVTYHETLRLPCDAIVFADAKLRLDIADVGKLACKLVIEAAQRAVSSAAESVLHDRGIPVLPNVALSIGAILLFKAILIGKHPAEAKGLLGHLDEQAQALVSEICRLASGLRITLRDATLRIAFRRWEQLPSTWVQDHG